MIQASDNTNGAAQSRNGFVFPPYIVLERGIPLTEWAGKPRRPMETIVMVEVLAELLGILHKSGRVHRDLVRLQLNIHASWWLNALDRSSYLHV